MDTRADNPGRSTAPEPAGKRVSFRRLIIAASRSEASRLTTSSPRQLTEPRQSRVESMLTLMVGQEPPPPPYPFPLASWRLRTTTTGTRITPRKMQKKNLFEFF